MKSTLYLNFDSDRENRIIIGKNPESLKPETPEETSLVLKQDIAILCEALINLITITDKNNYGDKKALVKACTDNINQLLDEG